ncbi:hypothetical protein BH24CHL4_BH24CHL4_26360 [soil metagenome]
MTTINGTTTEPDAQRQPKALSIKVSNGRPARIATVVPEAIIATARFRRRRSGMNSLAAVKQFANSAPPAMPATTRATASMTNDWAAAIISIAMTNSPASAVIHVLRENRCIHGAASSAVAVPTRPPIVVSCPTALSETSNSLARAVSRGLSCNTPTT